jgi:hypothetical protein
MIVIRHVQMAQFAADRRRRTLAGLCDALRASYPTQLTALTPIALYRRVMQAIGRAEAYGLDSEEDWRRYLELTVLHGWDFDQRPALAWMRQCLTDERISMPAARLTRLLDQCAYRAELDARNCNLRAQFALRRAARASRHKAA